MKRKNKTFQEVAQAIATERKMIATYLLTRADSFPADSFRRLHYLEVADEILKGKHYDPAPIPETTTP